MGQPLQRTVGVLLRIARFTDCFKRWSYRMCIAETLPQQPQLVVGSIGSSASKSLDRLNCKPVENGCGIAGPGVRVVAGSVAMCASRWSVELGVGRGQRKGARSRPRQQPQSIALTDNVWNFSHFQD